MVDKHGERAAKPFVSRVIRRGYREVAFPTTWTTYLVFLKLLRHLCKNESWLRIMNVMPFEVGLSPRRAPGIPEVLGSRPAAS